MIRRPRFHWPSPAVQCVLLGAGYVAGAVSVIVGAVFVGGWLVERDRQQEVPQT